MSNGDRRTGIEREREREQLYIEERTSKQEKIKK